MQGTLGCFFISRCNNTVPTVTVTKTKFYDLVSVDNGL